tara:strand:- start:2314 stop:2847 length:534 start_codon:yes stop_codon:yes gene_type:complete
MSITTIVTFIRVKDSKGTVQDRYQNGKRDNTNALEHNGKYQQNKGNKIELDGEDYYFLPFIYQGAAKNRSGDNLEAALVFANNPLAMNRAIEAVQYKWSIEVFVCRVDPDTLNPLTTYGNPYLTQDVWLASSMGYDPTTVEVLLSSGIDAVGSNAPNRVLTTSLVGFLPTSGQIQNR